MSLPHILFLACLVTSAATSAPACPFFQGCCAGSPQPSAQLNGEGPRDPHLCHFPWAAFFAAINYLLAHFSKAFFSAAIFHLFPLFLCILFHTCHRGILGWKTFISSNIGFCCTMLLLCLQQPNFLLPCTYLYCWVITQVNFLSCHSAIWHKVISLITGVTFQKLPGKADGQRCLPHVVQCSFIITAFHSLALVLNRGYNSSGWDVLARRKKSIKEAKRLFLKAEQIQTKNANIHLI